MSEKIRLARPSRPFPNRWRQAARHRAAVAHRGPPPGDRRASASAAAAPRAPLRGCGACLRPVIGLGGKLHDQQPTLGERTGERHKVSRQLALARDATLRRLAIAVDAREPRNEQPPQRFALAPRDPARGQRRRARPPPPDSIVAATPPVCSSSLSPIVLFPACSRIKRCSTKARSGSASVSPSISVL